MTTAEAIITLQRDRNDPGSVPIEEVNEAEGLAIAALNMMRGIERYLHNEQHTPSPGCPTGEDE